MFGHFEEYYRGTQIDNVKRSLETGTVKVKNVTKGIEFEVTVNLTEKEIDVINVGGRLNYVKHSN